VKGDSYPSRKELVRQLAVASHVQENVGFTDARVFRVPLKIHKPKVFTRPREAASGFFVANSLFLEVALIELVSVGLIGALKGASICAGCLGRVGGRAMRHNRQGPDVTARRFGAVDTTVRFRGKCCKKTGTGGRVIYL
jgi:hypothetical protein